MCISQFQKIDHESKIIYVNLRAQICPKIQEFEKHSMIVPQFSQISLSKHAKIQGLLNLKSYDPFRGPIRLLMPTSN